MSMNFGTDKNTFGKPCKNNCLFLAYLEIPAEFPQARFIFVIFGA